MEDNTILNSLIEDFKARYQRSMDKETLLRKEIEEYENLFDYQKWGLPTFFMGGNSSWAPVPPIIPRNDIYVVRFAYDYFVVRGNDTVKAGEWYKKEMEPLSSQSPEELEAKGVYYANLAKKCYECLQYLKGQVNMPQKYPDKYYAWYHQILINLGKETSFPVNFGKKEIIEFGKKRYNTGEGFYKAINNLDLTKTAAFVQSMNNRDRNYWKVAIGDISNNDAEVVNYLKKFSN